MPVRRVSGLAAWLHFFTRCRARSCYAYCEKGKCGGPVQRGEGPGFSTQGTFPTETGGLGSFAVSMPEDIFLVLTAVLLPATLVMIVTGEVYAGASFAGAGKEVRRSWRRRWSKRTALPLRRLPAHPSVCRTIDLCHSATTSIRNRVWGSLRFQAGRRGAC